MITCSVTVHAGTACIGGAADARMANVTMTTERSLIHIPIITQNDIRGRTVTIPENRLTGAGVVHFTRQMIARSLCNIQGRISKRAIDQTSRYFKMATEYVRVW